MGLADLHIHTTYSWDGTSTVQAVLKKAAEIALDVIAITDHDEIRGALEAQELASAYGVQVIPGSEISTIEGHLLALDIYEHIPKGLSLVETLIRIGNQGGIAIAAHPAARGMNSLRPETILHILKNPDLAQILVGIEVFNAAILHLKGNQIAQQLADSLPVAQTGSSDAHLLWMIGKGATAFNGSSAFELRRALECGITRAIRGSQNSRAYMMGHWLSRYILRRAGWVSTNTGPQAPLRLARQA